MTDAQELNDLKRAVVRYLSIPDGYRDDADLRELVEDYEPTEEEQGLIPIPKGYAEP